MSPTMAALVFVCGGGNGHGGEGVFALECCSQHCLLLLLILQAVDWYSLLARVHQAVPHDPHGHTDKWCHQEFGVIKNLVLSPS